MDYNYRSPLENAYPDYGSNRYAPYPCPPQRPWNNYYGGGRNVPVGLEPGPPYGNNPGHSRGTWRNESASYDDDEGTYSHVSERYSRTTVIPVHSPSGSNNGYSNRFQTTTLPKELNDLFGALECKLCAVRVQSPIVAKMHYSGKPHDRKMKQFLEEWCYRTGNPMPKINEAPSTSQTAGSSLPGYCELCDVNFTSTSDQVLHFSGKNHAKNARDPANAKKKRKAYETIDLSSNRFGIGTSFAGIDGPGPAGEEAKEIPQMFECELCDVKAVSAEQLMAHLTGKKHKEKQEKKNSAVPKPERPYRCDLCGVSLETHSQYRLHCDGKRHGKNLLKKEIAGSGDYCDVCNASFNSFEQYQSHLQGKKHEKMCKQMYTKTIEKPDPKVAVACEYCSFVGNMEFHTCDESQLQIKPDDSVKNWVCATCNNMTFESEEKLAEHKNSRRHMIGVLNHEGGDKVVEDLKHFYCFVCKKQCRSHKDYTEHLFEERHMAMSETQSDMVSKTVLFRCTVCDIMMDKTLKDEHMRDKVHLKKSLKKDTMTTLTNLANENIPTTNYHCSNCNVILPNFVKYSEHLLGDKHMDLMIREKLRCMRP